MLEFDNVQILLVEKSHTLDTKYTIGNEVFFIDLVNLEIKKVSIYGIEIKVDSNNKILVKYEILGYGDFEEIHLFDTKELAKKYLKDKIDEM